MWNCSMEITQKGWILANFKQRKKSVIFQQCVCGEELLCITNSILSISGSYCDSCCSQGILFSTRADKVSGWTPHICPTINPSLLVNTEDPVRMHIPPLTRDEDLIHQSPLKMSKLSFFPVHSDTETDVCVHVNVTLVGKLLSPGSSECLPGIIMVFFCYVCDIWNVQWLWPWL